MLFRSILLLLLPTPPHSISLMFLLLGVVRICDLEKVVCRVDFDFIPPHQSANLGVVLSDGLILSFLREFGIQWKVFKNEIVFLSLVV